MAAIIHAFAIPPIPAGLPRSGVIPLSLPQGSEVLDVLLADGAYLIVRGDLAQPMVPFSFVIVHSDVQLLPEEATAHYVGSLTGYRSALQVLDLYHVLQLA